MQRAELIGYQRRVVGLMLVLSVLGPGARAADEPAAATARVTPRSTTGLGRLFLTPEERRTLDARRNSTGEQDSATSPGDGTAANRPVERSVVLNGILTRSAGPDVIWMNGRQTDARSDEVQVRRGPDQASRVTIEDTADGSVAKLKPGQVWTPGTGRVANCYGCGRPTVVSDPAVSPMATDAAPSAVPPTPAGKP